MRETPEEREQRLIAEAQAEAAAEAVSQFQESLTDKPDTGTKSIWSMVLGGYQGFRRQPKIQPGDIGRRKK